MKTKAMPLWVCLVFNSKPLSQFQIKQTKWEHKHMFIVWLRCCNLKIKVTWFSNHFLNSFGETFKNYNLSFPLLPKEFWNHLFEHQRCKISIFFMWLNEWGVWWFAKGELRSTKEAHGGSQGSGSWIFASFWRSR